MSPFSVAAKQCDRAIAQSLGQRLGTDIPAGSFLSKRQHPMEMPSPAGSDRHRSGNNPRQSPGSDGAPAMAEQRASNDYWTTAEVIKGIYETKICVAKPHSPDACEGKIVAAHTIPRSHLRQIATNGHVYAMAATVADLVRHDGALSAMKYGIGDFSVLNCFCATHDNNVFTFCGVGFDQWDYDRHEFLNAA
jgi:hypothetical protein